MKRVNQLQAQKAAATTWKERRARINTISPGVIVTPLAYDEFAAAGDNYQQMIDASAAMRTGTSDEIAEAGAFLLGEHAGFITGTDLLIDGGVIAAIRTGEYIITAQTNNLPGLRHGSRSTKRHEKDVDDCTGACHAPRALRLRRGQCEKRRANPIPAGKRSD